MSIDRLFQIHGEDNVTWSMIADHMELDLEETGGGCRAYVGLDDHGEEVYLTAADNSHDVPEDDDPTAALHFCAGRYRVIVTKYTAYHMLAVAYGGGSEVIVTVHKTGAVA